MIEIQTEYAEKQEESCLYASGISRRHRHTHMHTHIHARTARWSSMQSMSHQSPPACQEDVWMQRPTTSPQKHKYIHRHTAAGMHVHTDSKTTQFSVLLTQTHTRTHTSDLHCLIYFPPQQMQWIQMQRKAAPPSVHQF